MKKGEINQTETIDWSKPQWVQRIGQPELVILTTGKSGETTFSGTALPSKHCKNGEYAESWAKSAFRPLTTDINFTISNQD